MNVLNKLSIGTAQFGQQYGLNSESNNIQASEAKNIINLCKKNDIKNIDTAFAYGDSESILGECDIADLKISTKFSLNDFNDYSISTQSLVKLIESSLKRMKIEKIENLFLHNSNDLFSQHQQVILDGIKELINLNMIKNFGLSVYTPDEFFRAIDLIDIKIIQAPVNFFDNRFLSKDILKKLNENNVSLQARSIFLQGLLLHSEDQLPTYFNKFSKELNTWYEFISSHELTSLEACLLFALSRKEISSIVFGVDNIAHLTDVIKCVNKINNNEIKFPEIKSISHELYDPRKWQLTEK